MAVSLHHRISSSSRLVARSPPTILPVLYLAAEELIEEFGDKVKWKRKVNGVLVASSKAKSKKCASQPTK
ncbi:hypothetical protein TRIUR3_30968 [Triticum urartu]|uniref:Uncharacterized protein n=1 Tax=Triticum urartu TaxID=4572 RepID=M7ZVH1_TRIUA|nr:hypothetical protein TRIUR3_30968 [Triticum urartu]